MESVNKAENFRPGKLNIEMIAKELGYSDHGLSTQIDVVLQFHKDRGLVLRSDQRLDTEAQYASDKYTQTIDEDGLAVIYASGNTFEIHTNGKPIELGPLRRVNADKVSFYSFRFDGIALLIVDEDREHIVPMYCDVEDLYADRDEFDQLVRQGLSPIPPYADPASEHYAPELVLAIEIHRALRIQGEHRPGREMRQRVRAYLTKNYPEKEISDSMEKRLSAIIGDKKK